MIIEVQPQCATPIVCISVRFCFFAHFRGRSTTATGLTAVVLDENESAMQNKGQHLVQEEQFFERSVSIMWTQADWSLARWLLQNVGKAWVEQFYDARKHNKCWVECRLNKFRSFLTNWLGEKKILLTWLFVQVHWNHLKLRSNSSQCWEACRIRCILCPIWISVIW